MVLYSITENGAAVLVLLAVGFISLLIYKFVLSKKITAEPDTGKETRAQTAETDYSTEQLPLPPAKQSLSTPVPSKQRKEQTRKTLSCIEQLPTTLWDHIFQYANLDDILQFSAASRVLRDTVLPSLHHLNVESESNLEISRPFIQQYFSSVKRIMVYTLIREHGDHKGIDYWDRPPYDFSFQTLRRLISFLSHFPSVENVFLGGLCRCGDQLNPYNDEKLRYDHWYSFDMTFDVDEHKAMFCDFLRDLCEAYRNQVLPANLIIKGAAMVQSRNPFKFGKCQWKNEDGTCLLCRELCEAFPVEEVLGLDTHGGWSIAYTPCVDMKKRFDIALRRRPDLNLTDLVIKALLPTQNICISQDRYCTKFDNIYEIEELIQRGANPKDPRIKKTLTTPWRKTGIYSDDLFHQAKFDQSFDKDTGRRYLAQETFDEFVRIGFEVDKTDFHVICPNSPEYRLRLVLNLEEFIS